MPNMDPKKCPMPSQDPNVRNKNFKEVALGYTAEMAVNEAKRCLQCKKPACRTGTPTASTCTRSPVPTRRRSSARRVRCAHCASCWRKTEIKG